MTFLLWKNYKKPCIILKTTFEIALFPIKEVREQTTIFDYYKYGYFPYEAFKKKQMCGPARVVFSKVK